MSRCVLTFCALLLACAGFARAASAEPATISGRVLDESTGLPLSAATVSIAQTAVRTVSGADGGFVLRNVTPGEYRLLVAHAGYQPALSEHITLTSSTGAVTLVLKRASSRLRLIATTTVRASESLVRSATFYRNLDVEALQQRGVERAADALRELPALNNGITGDTSAPADDVQLNIRGIGTLETEATLDGHPIALGMPGGFDYDLSPSFGLRNIDVTYGSGGTSLTGVDAIGGVVDFQTLDPTPDRQASIMQGYGTFEEYVTAARATGTQGRLGYAFAYGVNHGDGPVANRPLYQPGAAFDPSATDPAVRNLGVYVDDSAAVARNGLAKLVYAAAPASTLTLTTFGSSLWENKTGNGDGDYLDYGPALIFAQHLLSSKAAGDPCPAGTFTAKNANGLPDGTGPNGQPDGGMRCQTPQQYASFNAGYQGAGPAWQSLNLFDEDLAFAHRGDRSLLSADVYTDRYAQTFDRTWQLPFTAQPGDRALWRNREGVETGADLTDEVHFERNDVGFGLAWLNDTYAFAQDARALSVPATHETSLFVRDAYHPAQRLYAYANAWLKSASATNTAYLDPRLSLVYSPDVNDVVRFAVGKTTTQPSADQLGKSFVPSPPGNAGGGASITCAGLNSIGTAPSSVLKPESGVDKELALGHRFFADSQVQLSLFDVDVFDKLYSTLQSVQATGSAFIAPAYLSQVEGIVAAKCGVPDASALLGLSGTFNVGRLQSRGFTLDGRLRINPRLYVDYDWALTSTVLLSAPAQLLQSNQTLIPGDQLPRLPLHTLSASVNQTLGHGIDLRYTLHTVSVNNTKALPAYDYSDAAVSIAAGPGELNIGVDNLFNQHADDRGLRYEGVPLALNSYATAAAYAPVTGASSTEQFGLPYRRLFMGYTWRVR